MIRINKIEVKRQTKSIKEIKIPTKNEKRKRMK